MAGWGLGAWGSSGWGIPAPGDDLELVSAEPWRENVVRLGFNLPVHFTALLDPFDASDVSRYSIVVVDGTVGEDGQPARPVLPAHVELPSVDGARGRFLDLVVDRSFSPYPARYLVSVHQLRASTGELLLPGKTSMEFDGLAAARSVQMREALIGRGDFANPQSPLGVPIGAAALLGSYPVNESGDYASDRGLASYKKRVVRRLTSRKGAFRHLRDYGVGAIDQVKQLDRPGLREQLAADAETQIKREPETLSVKVSIVTLEEHPNVAWFRIRAKTRDGNVGMDVPFSTGG